MAGCPQHALAGGPALLDRAGRREGQSDVESESEQVHHQHLAGRQSEAHRVETFKLSRDPQFLEKTTDVVGLYWNPPQQAIVLCVYEKSQI